MSIMKNVLILALFLILGPAGYAQSEPIQIDHFDHSRYDLLLKVSVREGLVDYGHLSKSSMVLDQYIKRMAIPGQHEIEAMPRNQQIAFWINSYNAITLKYILEDYPVRSVKDIKGVWDRKQLPVGGRQVTLNQIEHEILRKIFKEPRIHFALVCASISCPELGSEAFTGQDLDAQLDEAARKFLNDPTRNRIDMESGTVYLSRIFDWYGDDFVKDFGDHPKLRAQFGKKLGAVLNYMRNHLSADRAAWIESGDYKVKFLPYDWGLNDGSQRVVRK
jgi:hypothetical protein